MFVILFCFIMNCLSYRIIDKRNQNLQICDIEHASKISDSTIVKKGYKLETLNKEITENDTLFQIYYYPKKTNRRGGDVDVKVSKKTCEVIEIKRYQ